jgi:rubredoxin
MNDEILKRLEARLDRRSFLRGSGLAMASLVGIAAASPIIAFAQTQEKPRSTDDKKKDEPDAASKDKTDEPKKDAAASDGDRDTDTKLDADGNQYRECPQCGHNMYRQGRTWTCENCGYSYIE